MSDYSHIKAIRFLPNKEFFDRVGVEPENILDLEELYPGLIGYKKPFQIMPTHGNTYIDLVLYDGYGSDEFYNVRYLISNEYEAALKAFKMFDNNYVAPIDCLRYVDCCWYDCSEPCDCFDVTVNEFTASKESEILEKIEKWEGQKK